MSTIDQPHTGLGDPPAAALEGPGSTKVSCQLMEDVVEAAEVFVADGAGKVGLFANPFLDGREETLVIDPDGFLWYLRRTPTETGWDQEAVKDARGAAMKAKEVVVVLHPRNLTLWAIVAPHDSDATGELKTLRLVSESDAETGKITGWKWAAESAAITYLGSKPLKTSRLYLDYVGRLPMVVATTQSGSLVRLGAVYTDDASFVCQAVTPPGLGPVEDLVGGQTSMKRSSWFVRSGRAVTRYQADGGSPRQQIADDAERLVGVFRGQVDLGLLYLDAAGNLKAWSESFAFPKGNSVAVAGTGFKSAAAWVDVNEMLHVYGLAPDTTGGTTLKVLHQVDWDQNVSPIWSRATVRKPPADGGASQAPRQQAETTVVCAGLVPKVASFAIDPLPDYLPNQLVKHAGEARASEKFSIHTQDIASDRWSRDKIRLSKSGEPHVVTHYVSTVTVLDRKNKPMPGLTVNVSAESLVEIQIDGASYLVGPGHSAQVSTDVFGRVSIASPADTLIPATLHVDAAGLEKGAYVQPATQVHDYLAGTGTLSTQKGLFNGTVLAEAKDHEGNKIVGKHTVAECNTVADHAKDAFVLAAGKPLTSRRFQGEDPAPSIHGFATGTLLSPIGSTGERTVVRTEFDTPDDVKKYLKKVRELPEYGGLWDDFVHWAGDVWEGIKNGVIRVAGTVVHAVTSVFIWIGDKIVELVGLVIDTIETAVRVVEAAVRMVVDSVSKVVDWLKALFNFTDIWHTKQALEDCLHTVSKYTVRVLDHYKGDLHAWFESKEADARSYFEEIKKHYLAQPPGNATNQLPPATDPSGHAITQEDLVANPQATWLLDRAVGPRALAAASLDRAPLADSAIIDSFTKFMDDVASSDILATFTGLLGDLAVLAVAVVDPADPAMAAKASMIKLIDLVEQALLKILKALDKLVSSALTLVADIGKDIDTVLGLPLNLGPVNALYKWLQPAGSGPAEELTLGGVACLIGGFAVTVALKLVNGVDFHPFPNGTFPGLPEPYWPPKPGSNEAGVGEAFAGRAGRPAAGGLALAELKYLKGVGGLALCVGAPFNAFADVLPVLPAFMPKGDGRAFLAACNVALTLLPTAVLAIPDVNGKPWTDAAASANFALAGTCFLLGAGTLVANAHNKDWFTAPAIKNLGLPGDKKPTVGPILMFAFSTARLICAAVDNPPNDYAKALIGVSSITGFTELLRIGIDPKDVRFRSFERAAIAGVVDLLAQLTAGMMTAVPSFMPGPTIPPQKVKKAIVNEKYSHTLERTGEHVFNKPLKWSLTAKPDWLSINAETGELTGTPKAVSPEAAFNVTFTDSYAPPQTAAERTLTIEVAAS